MSMNNKTETLLSLLDEYKALGIAEQIDYNKFYLYSLITHSTAIEGSTVTEIENQLLFDEGITAKGRSLQEQMMNLDLKAAYELSMKLAKAHADFSVDMLKGLSALVMKNTGGEYNTASGSFDSSKGELRLLGVTAGVGGSSYMNFRKVPAKLEEFCRYLNSQRKELLNINDIISQYQLSFEAHYQLVTIHPWVDGNGRMSRLVMNHLQYEFGLIPSKVVRDDKTEYIQSLIDAREQETLLPFYEFMFDEHIRNISKEIEAYKKSQAADLIKPVSDPINDISDPITERLYQAISQAADLIKPVSDPINDISDPITERLYQAILKNNKLNYAEYGALLGVSEATIKRRLGELRKAGMIVRVGSNKSGYWEVVSLKDRKEGKV